MNENLIETLLSQAPCPVSPGRLLKQLQQEIVLPRVEAERDREDRWAAFRNPLRRWMPTLAFGLFLLSCIILVGMQANWIRQIRQGQKDLRAVAATLPELRQSQARAEQLQIQQTELARLRAGKKELAELQAEVESLRTIPQQIQKLKADNQRLATATKPAGAAAGTFFEEAQQEAERIACVNNLKQLGLAARISAGDYEDRYPTSLVVMSNELSTTKILICPGDKSKAANYGLPFSQFRDEMSSYPFFATGSKDDETTPEGILAKCPIHSNYLLNDGSVQQINPAKYREVKRDRYLYLEQISSQPTP